MESDSNLVSPTSSNTHLSGDTTSMPSQKRKRDSASSTGTPNNMPSRPKSNGGRKSHPSDGPTTQASRLKTDEAQESSQEGTNAPASNNPTADAGRTPEATDVPEENERKMSESLPLSEVTYTVHLQHGLKGKPKGDQWTRVQEETAVMGNHKVAYAVAPGKKWESMRKYTKFTVPGGTFAVNDLVFINHVGTAKGEDIDDDTDCHIAKVLEIRAVNSHEVYLRVFWMYLPEDLPNGREPYHGKFEMIASNYMQIIDAMSVSHGATVRRLPEKDNDEPCSGRYWRQTFDVIDSKLSTLRQYCTCGGYYNPDKLLIQCPHKGCRNWMLEDCLAEEAAKGIWARSSDGKEPSEMVTTDGDDIIEVRTTEGSPAIHVGKANGFANGNAKANSLSKRRGRKPKDNKRAKVLVADQPWFGVLEPRLETQPKETGETDAPVDEDDLEITGKAIVKDLRDGTEHVVSLECLFCHQSLEK